MLDIFPKLNSYVFFIAFAIGIFYAYITFPEPKIIFKHPSPENVEHTLYQDEDNNCYKYTMEEVKCPLETEEHPLNIK